MASSSQTTNQLPNYTAADVKFTSSGKAICPRCLNEVGGNALNLIARHLNKKICDDAAAFFLKYYSQLCRIQFHIDCLPKKDEDMGVLRNGYEAATPAPSFKPYALNNPGFPRQSAFAFDGETSRVKPLGPLDDEEWNLLAEKHGLLPAGAELRDFQHEAANVIIQRQDDLCLIAPTGAGKSLVWTLPLLAQNNGISLVVTPYTSLGKQGAQNQILPSTFINSENKGRKERERVASGAYRIVHVCAEMLESPSFAPILHSAPKSTS
ncbi:hypothetical protein C8J56DRAFT_1163738 [Mycena floridula]|nr:hypothetical protein C8J56DRAFT_1163738 [Mycena floridula]